MGTHKKTIQVVISEHIAYEEAIRSQTAIRKGINNEPDLDTVKRMIHVAINCFEPVRRWYGKPLIVSSFYRSPELNKAVGGSETSQHCKGEAIDIDTGNREENKKIFEWLKDNLPEWDQLIDEYDFSWVHISLKKEGNRKQILIIK